MKAKRRWLIAGIVVGALLTFSPLVGVLGTIFGMNRAFHTLGQSGIANPQELSESIGTTLLFTASGVFLFPLGLVLLAFSLVFFLRLRAASPPPLPPREDHAA